MIDEEKTFNQFGYKSTDLKPKSNKKIIAICEMCGKIRELPKYAYHDLCRKCSKIGENNPNYMCKLTEEEKHQISEKMIKFWCDNPKKKQEYSERMENFWKNNPDKLQEMAERSREYWNNFEHRKEMSEKSIEFWKNNPDKLQEMINKNKKYWGQIKHQQEMSEKLIDFWKNNPDKLQEMKQKISAIRQGIPYEEWENFASNSLYCPDFNEECRESNRKKYDRKCFLTNLPESENITSTGKQKKLSVHHVDMDKMQGCDGRRWKLIPVCMKWHGKVHNELWEARIIWLLNNVWM